MTPAELERKLVEGGKQKGLSILLRPISEGEDKKEKSSGAPCVISVYGADKPGIVYTISKFLSEKNVNITDVQTNILTGKKKPVYVMFLEVDLPRSVSLISLKTSLKRIAARLKVTVTLQAAETPMVC